VLQPQRGGQRAGTVRVQRAVRAVCKRARRQRARQRVSAAVVQAAQQRTTADARLRPLRQAPEARAHANDEHKTTALRARTSSEFSGPSAWRSRRHSSCSEQKVSATMPKLALVVVAAASAGSLRTSA